MELSVRPRLDVEDLQKNVDVYADRSYCPFAPSEIRFKRNLRDQLHYLAGNHEIFLDEETYKLLEKSNRVDNWAKLWLGVCGFAPMILVGGCAYISFIALDKSISESSAALITGTVGAVSTIVSNIMGMHFTGIHIVNASNIDNERQNAVNDLAEIYKKLSYELIDLAEESPDYAEHLARRIHAALPYINPLVTKLKINNDDKSNESKIFDLFRNTVNCVARQQEWSFDMYHEFRDYIQIHRPALLLSLEEEEAQVL